MKAKQAVDLWLAQPVRTAFPAECRFGWPRITGSYPHWWDRLYHTRPARRQAGLLLQKIERGGEDAERWPDYRKPHKYYW